MIHRLPVLALIGLLSWGADSPPEWSRPFTPHRVAGHIYYVGTEDLACFLITDPAGHILLNTGLANSVPQIRANVEKLGFQMKDIRILLTNQAHFDHVAGFAEMQKLTGAEVYATPPDARLMEDGGKSDPLGGVQYAYEPVKVARRLKDGETVRLGKTALTVRFTPGHSPGSASYETFVEDGGSRKSFVFANMGTVVMPLVVNTKYPGIVKDFRETFAKQRAMHPEIWVAAHASQYGMKEKLAKGSFVDPEGFAAAVERHQKRFEQQLKIEGGAGK